jgi:uncharacterized membrane protein YfhO
MKIRVIRSSAYISSFLLPLILMGMVYALKGVYPFGEKSVLMGDLYTQYIQFYNHLYDVLKGDGSLLYSWEAGMGLNFWATFAYYLSSPISFIIVLFDRSHLPEAVVLITLTKIGLSGLFMYIYLSKMYESLEMTRIMFSTMYSLISFTVGYSFNLMWLDGIYLLPLVLLGIEFLLRGKRPFFIIVLAILFISNFYMAYIIGIFTFLYFIKRSLSISSGKKLFFKNFVSFILCTINAGGISAILTIPTYLHLKGTSYPPTDGTGLIDPAFSFFQFFAKLYNGGTFLFDLPDVYSGLLALLLFPLFFILNEVKAKEKGLYLILVVGVSLSLQIKLLNLIWHAFESPVGYLYRFAFIFSFLIIILAFRVYLAFEKKYIPALIKVYFINIIILMLLPEINTELMSVKKALVNIILISIFALLLYAKTIYPSYQRILPILLLFFICVDLSVNAYRHIGTLNSLAGYSINRNDYNMAKPGFETIVNWMNHEDEGFYRMNTNIRLTPNDSFRFNYKSMSNFNTLSNGTLHEAMYRLGYSTTLGPRSLMQNNGVLVTDALFGFKYFVSDQPINKHGYELVHCKEGVCLYKNMNATPIGFMTENQQTVFQSKTDNPFDIQNQLLGAIDGSLDYFYPLKPSTISYKNLQVQNDGPVQYFQKIDPTLPGSINMTFDLKDKNQLYTLLSAGKGFAGFNETEVFVNGKSAGVYPTFHNERILDLGAFSSETVNVTIQFLVPETQLTQNMFYALDIGKFEERIQQIKAESINVTSWNATSIKGNINVTKPDNLFFSIPYDPGWSAEIDEEFVPVIKIGGFIGINIEQGQHVVELNYKPKGFNLGLLISLFSLFTLGILSFLDLRKKKSLRIKWDKDI